MPWTPSDKGTEQGVTGREAETQATEGAAK